jgi:hypothetical protein
MKSRSILQRKKPPQFCLNEILGWGEHGAMIDSLKAFHDQSGKRLRVVLENLVLYFLSCGNGSMLLVRRQMFHTLGVTRTIPSSITTSFWFSSSLSDSFSSVNVILFIASVTSSRAERVGGGDSFLVLLPKIAVDAELKTLFFAPCAFRFSHARFNRHRAFVKISA